MPGATDFDTLALSLWSLKALLDPSRGYFAASLGNLQNPASVPELQSL